jgi:hypothetical protein
VSLQVLEVLVLDFVRACALVVFERAECDDEFGFGERSGVERGFGEVRDWGKSDCWFSKWVLKLGCCMCADFVEAIARGAGLYFAGGWGSAGNRSKVFIGLAAFYFEEGVEFFTKRGYLITGDGLGGVAELLEVATHIRIGNCGLHLMANGADKLVSAGVDFRDPLLQRKCRMSDGAGRYEVVVSFVGVVL